jgi:TP901 family phage tail tape measure protein
MRTSAGTAWVDFKGDFSSLRREAAQEAAVAGRSFSSGFGKAMSTVGAQQKKHFETVTRGAKIAAAGVGAAGVLAVKDLIQTGAGYEAQMSRVKAVSDATGKQMGKLDALAIELGAKTKFSAGEAAEGMYELSSAGFGVSEMADAIPGTLDLAAASNIALADAAEISSNALRGFGLDASESTHVADALAESVNTSSVEMDDLQLSLKYIGPVAKATGQDLEEMLAAVDVMGDAGIKGEQAGTTLRAGLLRLVKPTKQVKEGLADLGLTTEDVTGPKGLLPLPQLIAKLQSGMGDLSKSQQAQALASIFGTEAMSGMYELVDAGPAKLERLTKSLEHSDGTAEKASKTMLDNVSGAWEEFSGSVETAEIIAFKEFRGPIQDALHDATDFANEIGAIMSDDRLDFGERLAKSAQLAEGELEHLWDNAHIGEHVADAIDAAVPVVASHAGQLGLKAVEGFGEGFLHADPLGKAVMATWAINFLGGRAAFAGVGKFFGISLGKEIAVETAATVARPGATQAIAGALAGGAAGGRWLGTDTRVARAGLEAAGMGSLARQTERQALAAQGGIFGGIAGKSAGAGIAGGIIGTLKSIQWGRIGAVGLGLTLADDVVSEFDRRSREKSGDLLTELHAQIEGTKLGAGPLSVHLHKNDGSLFDPFGVLSDTDEVTKLKNVNAELEEMSKRRVQLSQSTIEGLRAQAEELNLTKKARAQLDQMLRVAEQGHQLHLGVDLGMNPEKIAQFQQGLSTLKSGVLTSMHDIRKVTRDNLSIVSAEFGLKTKEGRDAVAQNYRAEVIAIGKAMADQEITVKQGLARQKELLRDANLISGDDPFGIAKGFRNSWRKAGSINDQQRKQAIDDLGKMAPKARQQAFNSMVQYAHGLVQGGKLPRQDLKDFVSSALSTFSDLTVKGKGSSLNLAIGVSRNFGSMGGAIANVLELIKDNTNQSLGAFGANPLDYAIKQVGDLLGLTGGSQERQTGGFIVPGTGSGDTFRTALPAGSFIENREAARAQAFAEGGRLMPVALEPGERVYLPPEVKQLGADNLEARNRAIPRFQKGGLFEKPEISGPGGPLLDIAHGAEDKAYKAAMKYIAQHRPKGGPGYSGPPIGPAGTSSYKGVLMAIWVKEALEYAASQGVSAQPTSGYRSHAENVAHGRNYFSEHEKTQYPGGAVDFGGYVDPAAKAVKDAVVAATRGFKYPLLAPVGFRDDGHASGTGHQLGGLLQELADGGWVKTGYTTYDEDGPGAFGDLMKGKGYAELGAATSSGSGTGSGFIAKALGMSGELPKDYALDVKIGNHSPATLYKRDRGYGQGDPYYSIDIHHLAWPDVGLSGNSKGNAFIRPAGGKGGSTEEDVPAEYHGAKTKDLSLGPMPKSLPGVEKELTRRRGDLRRYRLAAKIAATKGKPKIQHAIEVNITALESWVRQLEHERAKLRREAAKKKFSKKLGKRLAKLTGFETLIEGKERTFNIASQRAEQLVDLEPLAPQLAASATDAEREDAEKKHVAGLTAYIEGQERPAYTHLLETAADWRNAIVLAEQAAAGDWASSKTLGGLEGNWEDNVISIDHEIDQIVKFSKSHSDKWWKEHPKADAFLHQQLAKLPMLRFKDRELRKALGEARGEFFPGKARVRPPQPPLPGSGTFEDALSNVQGIHWPDQHELLASLPGGRSAGSFGGVIWDVQTSIAELGLRISEAASSLDVGTSAGQGDDERAQLLEELLRQERERKVADSIWEDIFHMGLQGGGSIDVMPPYAGKAHVGAIVPGPSSKEKTMVVKGGEGVFTEEQMRRLQPVSPGPTTEAPVPRIEVQILDGAVDPSKIRVVAKDEAEVVVRGHAQRASSPSAGRGGEGWR